ncbi:NAD-dependent epimerase/dehydratase family protein [Aquabacter sp. P-9]|nr:NAD-dependent epimerase/dehydratase family protein [Aquabacter sp. P-9]MDE1566951.1 NAD-dependent epimerase/dehydratase family protein [Aquabacter sp. P-9]
MVRVLVTGTAGFIGCAVAQRLLRDGATVLGIDCLTPYYDLGLKEERVKLLRGSPAFAERRIDLADGPATLAAVRDFLPDVVVHLAAQAGIRYSLDDPRSYTHSNVEGTLSVLEACRAVPVKHLIYASSSSVYGANTRVPFRETDRVDAPVSLYAATKRANELMVQTYSHLFRIPASGLRFFTVYGPLGRPDMAYFKFTKAIFEGEEIDVYNHGRMKRDFTYIDEVVEAIERLMLLPPVDRLAEGDIEPGRILPDVPHRLFNVGNHTPIPLERFIDVLEEIIGRKARRRLLPMQPGDVVSTFADVSALQQAVGFSPSTPIEVGLTEFVDWYRAFYNVS